MAIELKGDFDDKTATGFRLVCEQCGAEACMKADIALGDSASWVKMSLQCVQCGREVELFAS